MVVDENRHFESIGTKINKSKYRDPNGHFKNI